MKRESAAERALNRQIKILKAKLVTITASRDSINIQRESLLEIIRQFEEEVERSKAMRLAAVEAKKP